MEESFEIESSNIHSKWLDNIYGQFIKIQEMETLALEGCSSLAEFLEIPQEVLGIIIPEIQYKNLRFIIREIKLIIDNLSPVLKDDIEDFRTELKPLLKFIDERKLFLKDVKRDGQIINIYVTPFFKTTVDYILNIKSKLIMNGRVMKILYYEEEKKKW